MQFRDQDDTRSRTLMSDNNTNACLTLNVMCFVLRRDESIDTLELDALDITIPSSQHVNKIRSEMEVAAHNKLYFKQCSVIHCNAAPVPCRPLSRKHRPPALAGITCRGVSSRLDLVNDKMLDHWIPYI